MSLKFTTIQHDFRKSHLLTCNEYVLADMVYFLSTNPQSKVPGWAYKSRTSMADDLGISKQTILNLLKSLEEKGLIEKNPVSAFLRTTAEWNKVYFTTGKESLPPVQKSGKESGLTGKESLPHAGKESLPYNNSLDNNNDNNKSIVGLPTATTTKEPTFSERCSAFIDKFNEIKVVNGKRSKYQLNKQVTDRLRLALKTYTALEIVTALRICLTDPHHIENNFMYVTPEFILRINILERYLNASTQNVTSGPAAPGEVYTEQSRVIDHSKRSA